MITSKVDSQGFSRCASNLLAMQCCMGQCMDDLKGPLQTVSERGMDGRMDREREREICIYCICMYVDVALDVFSDIEI